MAALASIVAALLAGGPKFTNPGLSSPSAADYAESPIEEYQPVVTGDLPSRQSLRITETLQVVSKVLSAVASLAFTLGKSTTSASCAPETVMTSSGPVPDCTEKLLQGTRGLLVDLDGTIYNDHGLLPGAHQFYHWADKSRYPYVLLSNSGAKGAEGTQAKLATAPFDLTSNPSMPPVPLKNILTGAMAAADFLIEKAKPGSRIFILQSLSRYGGIIDCFRRVLERRAPRGWMEKMEIRTYLSTQDAKIWARDAVRGKHMTYVALAGDGDIRDEEDWGYSTWDYDMLQKAVWIISNGGFLVTHARDTHNPKLAREEGFEDVDLMVPGPGTFEALIKSATYPKAIDRTFNTGKGGNLGGKYMMDKAMKMLKGLGLREGKDRVVIIGDTLDTDIQAANDFGIRSVLLRSGVHTEKDLLYYPGIRPTCIADNLSSVVEMIRKGRKLPPPKFGAPIPPPAPAPAPRAKTFEPPKVPKIVGATNKPASGAYDYITEDEEDF